MGTSTVTTSPALSARQLPAWKRGMDLVLGGTILVVSSPLLALCWAAVRLTSPGPALYWSARVGKDNRIFGMPKFRTMRIDTPQLATHLLRQPERYLTPIGALLRKTSLDELPQLWNVLKGDMSLVGPRPIVDQEISKYGARFELYTRVKGGITGLWQVSGRNDTSYEERIRLDLFYVRNWSVWLDFCILFRTIAVVLFRKGAY